jgi:hypothetical protein
MTPEEAKKRKESFWRWRFYPLSKKTPSFKVGEELRTNLLNVHMTIT